jgi:hypothetical protein
MRESSLALDYGFIMFNPFSNFSTLRQNADFLEEGQLDVDAPILQRRLEIYQGSAITTHVRTKGLLNPENDPVVIDSFGYRFASSPMEGLWAILRELDNIPVHSDFLDLVKAFTRKVADDREPDHRAADLIATVSVFRKESARLWLSFFRSTLDLAEAGKAGWERRVRSDMHAVRARLGELWSAVFLSLDRWDRDELRPWGLDVSRSCLEAKVAHDSDGAPALAS